MWQIQLISSSFAAHASTARIIPPTVAATSFLVISEASKSIST